MTASLSPATVEAVQRSDGYYRAQGLYASGDDVGGTWGRLAGRLGRRYLSPRGVDVAALAQFRRRRLFVVDEPPWEPEGFSWRRLLDPSRRAILTGLGELYDRMCAAGHRELLEKLPPCRVGEPYVATRDGIPFTKRHAWALRALALFRDHVEPRLGDDRLVILDIGGAEGLFVELLRRACPRHAAILVDFAEQLVVTEAYLRESHPDARILTARAYGTLASWTPAALREHDVVLVPIQHAEHLARGAADVVANFVSFTEMSRASFARYLTLPVYQGARMLLTVNRFTSYPHLTGITILDYPVWEPTRRVHLAVSSIVTAPRVRPFGPWFRRDGHIDWQFFEYVGWI